MKTKIKYLTKKEIKPYKNEFNELFKKIKNEFFNNLSLSYRLVRK